MKQPCPALTKKDGNKKLETQNSERDHGITEEWNHGEEGISDTRCQISEGKYRKEYETTDEHSKNREIMNTGNSVQLRDIQQKKRKA